MRPSRWLPVRVGVERLDLLIEARSRRARTRCRLTRGRPSPRLERLLRGEATERSDEGLNAARLIKAASKTLEERLELGRRARIALQQY